MRRIRGVEVWWWRAEKERDRDKEDAIFWGGDKEEKRCYCLVPLTVLRFVSSLLRFLSFSPNCSIYLYPFWLVGQCFEWVDVVFVGLVVFVEEDTHVE